MVEPRLKLVVQYSSGYLDEPTWLSVVHDPLMDSAQLTKPMSEFDERSWYRLHSAPPPPQLIRSERAETLLKIPLRIDRDKHRLVIVVQDEGRPIAFDERLVDQVDCALLGNGNLLLRSVLNAGLLLPVWDREATQSYLSHHLPDQSRIALYVSEQMAERLIERDPIKLPDSPAGLVLLNERGVRTRPI